MRLFSTSRHRCNWNTSAELVFPGCGSGTNQHRAGSRSACLITGRDIDLGGHLDSLNFPLSLASLAQDALVTGVSRSPTSVCHCRLTNTIVLPTQRAAESRQVVATLNFVPFGPRRVWCPPDWYGSLELPLPRTCLYRGRRAGTVAQNKHTSSSVEPQRMRGTVSSVRVWSVYCPGWKSSFLTLTDISIT